MVIINSLPCIKKRPNLYICMRTSGDHMMTIKNILLKKNYYSTSIDLGKDLNKRMNAKENYHLRP